jgi:hypothetical protein
LEDMFSNDSIHAPAVVPNLLEHLWTSWRNGVIDDQQAQTELDAVTQWLNATTHAKPRTDFWNKYF